MKNAYRGFCRPIIGAFAFRLRLTTSDIVKFPEICVTFSRLFLSTVVITNVILSSAFSHA